MGLPQIAIIVLYAFNLGAAGALHGRPQKPINVWYALAGTCINIALLFLGGFFS